MWRSSCKKSRCAGQYQHHSSFMRSSTSFPIAFPLRPISPAPCYCMQAFFHSLAAPSGLPIRPISPAPATQSRQQSMQLVAAMGRCGAAGRAALAAAYIDMLRTYAPHPAMVSVLISIRMTLVGLPFILYSCWTLAEAALPSWCTGCGCEGLRCGGQPQADGSQHGECMAGLSAGGGGGGPSGARERGSGDRDREYPGGGGRGRDER